MKIAIVTGASSGMGREAVCQLWEQFEGIDEIWVIARRENRLKELKNKVGVPLRTFALDLTSDREREVLASALKEASPKVKFLVNAAGFGKIGQSAAIAPEDERDMVRVNCEALTAVTRLVLPYMPENSRILQFASSAAFLPQPGFAVYAATKSYVLSYSLALGRELAGRRIYVTAVCPGPVATEFFDVAETEKKMPGYKKLFMAKPEKVVAKALRDSIAGRSLSVYGCSMKAWRLLCKILPMKLIWKLMDSVSG